MAATAMSGKEASRIVDKATATIGKLCINANHVDLLVFEVFAALLKSDPLGAKSVYFAMDAFPTKKNMIKRLADARCDKATCELIKSLLDSAQKVINPRNGIAHSVAMFDAAGDPVLVNHRKMTGFVSRLGDSMLDDAMLRSGEALKDCRCTFEQLCPMLGIGHSAKPL